MASAQAQKAEGTILYKAGRLVEALESYNKAHELDPENPVYLSNVSACFYELGDYRAAAEQCDHALRLEPDQVLRKKLLSRQLKSLFYCKAFERCVLVLEQLRALGSLDKLSATISCALALDRAPGLDPTCLPLCRAPLKPSLEYFNQGHDDAHSALSGPTVREGVEEEAFPSSAKPVVEAEDTSLQLNLEQLLSETGHADVAVFYGGCGDARHCLATLAAVHDQVAAAASLGWSGVGLQLVVNDIKPHCLARFALLCHYLIPMGEYTLRQTLEEEAAAEAALMPYYLYLSFFLLKPQHASLLALCARLAAREAPPEEWAGWFACDAPTWESMRGVWREWADPGLIGTREMYKLTKQALKANQRMRQLMTSSSGAGYATGALAAVQSAEEDHMGQMLAHLDSLPEEMLDSLVKGARGAPPDMTAAQKRQFLRTVMESVSARGDMAELQGVLPDMLNDHLLLQSTRLLRAWPRAAALHPVAMPPGQRDRMHSVAPGTAARKAMFSGWRANPVFIAADVKEGAGGCGLGASPLDVIKQLCAPYLNSDMELPHHFWPHADADDDATADATAAANADGDGTADATAAANADDDGTADATVAANADDDGTADTGADAAATVAAAPSFSTSVQCGAFKFALPFLHRAAVTLARLSAASRSGDGDAAAAGNGDGDGDVDGDSGKRGGICIEFCAGDMNETALSLQRRRPTLQFDRVYSSNVNDYVGLLSTFVCLLPLLRAGDHRALLLNGVLLNTGLFRDTHEFLHSSTMITSTGDHLRKALGLRVAAGSLWQTHIAWGWAEDVATSPAAAVAASPVAAAPPAAAATSATITATAAPASGGDTPPLAVAPASEQGRLSQPEFRLWLLRVFLSVVQPCSRRVNSPMIEVSPLTLSLFFRLLLFLRRQVGYPSHWIARLLRDLLTNTVATTASPPSASPVPIAAAPPLPLQASNKRKSKPKQGQQPPKKKTKGGRQVMVVGGAATPRRLDTRPYLSELRTLTALWLPALPFPLPLPPSAALPQRSSIRLYSVRCRGLLPPFAVPHHEKAILGAAVFTPRPGDLPTVLSASPVFGTSSTPGKAVDAVVRRERRGACHLFSTLRFDAGSSTLSLPLPQRLWRDMAEQGLCVVLYRSDAQQFVATEATPVAEMAAVGGVDDAATSTVPPLCG